MFKLLTYDKLCELARPSTFWYKNLVYIQFRALPQAVTMSDYYRVERCYIEDSVFDARGKPFHLSRLGRGKRFGESDGFKKSTYMKEWRAYLVDTESMTVKAISMWGDDDDGKA